MTRRQSNNQWSGAITVHPAPKNSECKNPLEKFSRRFFWGDQEGTLLIGYNAKGQSINEEYYSSQQVQLKDILKEKRRGKVTKGSCSCTTMPRLTGHLQPRRNRPIWASPDLAPSVYHLFPGLKKQLKFRNFSSDAEVIAVAETWLDGQPSDFFLEWLAKVRATR